MARINAGLFQTEDAQHGFAEATKAMKASRSRPSFTYIFMVSQFPIPRQPPLSPGENLTEPGLTSVWVSLINVDSLSTVKLNAVSETQPSRSNHT